MSLKATLTITVGAGFLLMAAPAFADSSNDANFAVPGSAAVVCANAAANAAAQQTASKSDVAACTLSPSIWPRISLWPRG